ncbi:MAG TPA: carboxypeptidase-like regulatory domain-containing protein [Thermoanaerobaculia bacterium]|jgi:hypothetical protein
MRTLFALILLAAFDARAATLQLTIDRGEMRGPLEVHVGVRGDHEEGMRWTAIHRMPPNGSTLAIGDLAPGIIAIQVRGAGPLERAAAQMRIGDGLSAMTIPLHGKTLRGAITDDGVPLANAKVRFVRNDDLWDAEVATDARGTFAATYWQEGDVQVELYGGGLQGLVSTQASLRGDAMNWTFAIPMRTVRGKVVDEEGKPIAGAKVTLRRSDERASRLLTGRSGADGSFSFRGVAAGVHTLRVAADDFLVSAREELRLGERADEQRTITMQRGARRTITVVDSTGAPATKAVVVCATGSVVHSNGFTDGLGRITLPVPASGRSAIYVFSPRGSLGVLRVCEASAMRIALPAATSRVEVSTLTTKNEPVPHLWLLMRYDGEIIPPEVVKLARRAGLVLNTDDDGRLVLRNLPKGRYEFWPYANDAQAEALLASSVDVAAPVVLDVSEGTHRATLRFAR